jgi:putative transposase
MIESINYRLRKVTKTRGHFPTDDALVKLLHRSNYNWKAALNQFDLILPGRLDRA